jgi:hypothetical protein
MHAAINYYTANDHFEDHACKLSFSSKAALFYHILGGALASGSVDLPGNRCAHRDRVLKQFHASANIVADVNALRISVFPRINCPLQIRADVTKYDPILCIPVVRH